MLCVCVSLDTCRSNADLSGIASYLLLLFGHSSPALSIGIILPGAQLEQLRAVELTKLFNIDKLNDDVQ